MPLVEIECEFVPFTDKTRQRYQNGFGARFMPHFNDKDFKLGHVPKGSNENTAEMEFHNHYMHTAHGKHRATSGDIETGQ